ncbi:glycogen synthase GlgA [Rhodoferax fermentans]|uniref:Glycogen synthase n=1 Tax=Rhodoferax fermentans TaxID=28066 RepID=A0A1T1AR62_RHOFE|nr:glycogen synthase GlgA [Rhodoferax fermentans]MBK1684623.1 glycogen synthase GlgA [Rhodoferax fermentans]OOV06483.1 starch synthase [Rhodoferax fermentans]
MNVLQVSAEIFPLLKTGGLADIAGALPSALQSVGCQVRVVLPGFPAILADLTDSWVLAELTAPWGERLQVRQGRLRTLELDAYVIDLPHLYERPGSPYEDAWRQPYADNHRRFALLGWVAAQLAHGLDPHWQPQVVHSHDWHAGLTSAYMAFMPHRSPRVATVFTVHNLAYQGVFSPACFYELGLPHAAFAVNGVEFYGQVSFMKAGLYYADHITTVSPTYAREIQTPEQGCGFDGLLRTRSGALSGILNAVDDAVWNPATDPYVTDTYDVDHLGGKARCKASLQQELGLSVQSETPLFGIVSRLTGQKGLHLVLGALDFVLSRGGQLVLLGTGEAHLESIFKAKAAQYPQAVSVRIGYDEAYAHRVFAATDVTLVPSQFEPCGLTQMYGLKYGSLPLVHRVGGLADTVVDCSLENLAEGRANGFVFDDFNQPALERAMARAFALYARKTEWKKVRACGMRQDLGWQSAARQYVTLYQHLYA